MKNDWLINLMIAIMIGAGATAFFILGFSLSRDEAARAGVAHYEFNPVTGYRVFVYHTNNLTPLKK